MLKFQHAISLVGEGKKFWNFRRLYIWLSTKDENFLKIFSSHFPNLFSCQNFQKHFFFKFRRGLVAGNFFIIFVRWSSIAYIFWRFRNWVQRAQKKSKSIKNTFFTTFS